jgi:4-hydroxy-tetrahydrodipicolinate synthase
MASRTLSLQGVTTALVTPFTDGEQVDFDAFAALVEKQIGAGVAGVLPLGTTGETPTLTREECDRIISLTVEVSAGRVPVMVGTGTNSTRSTIENTKRAHELGADIALVVTPYYNKPGQAGIVRHYEQICKETTIPVLQYNIAGRCGVNVGTDAMVELAKIPTVIGVKEASGDLHQIAEVIERTSAIRDDFTVLSGDDALTIHVISLGGVGVVSVVSNLVPKPIVDLVAAGLAGNLEELRKRHFELLPLFRVAFCETNPAPVKHALMRCGMISGRTVRSPLLELSEKGQSEVDRILEELKLLS